MWRANHVQAVLLLHGLYLSFKTRNVDARFERSSMIMLAMYQYAIAIIIFVLIDHTANLTLWEYQLMFCSLLTFACLTSLCCIILPKVLSNRSEEHTSELQSLMRISYAVFCLKKKQTI